MSSDAVYTYVTAKYARMAACDAKRTELSNEEKTGIESLKIAGCRPTEIARILSKPASTIYSVLKRITDSNSIKNKERKGRLSILNSRDSRHLLRTVI